jgi:hypothetical protein
VSARIPIWMPCGTTIGHDALRMYVESQLEKRSHGQLNIDHPDLQSALWKREKPRTALPNLPPNASGWPPLVAHRQERSRPVGKTGLAQTLERAAAKEGLPLLNGEPLA